MKPGSKNSFKSLSKITIDNKDYKYFVCDGFKILSGWEYKEDAKDSILDEPNPKGLKIFSRTYLKQFIPGGK